MISDIKKLGENNYLFSRRVASGDVIGVSYFIDDDLPFDEWFSEWLPEIVEGLDSLEAVINKSKQTERN